MAETAAHLTDQVLPRVGYRQRVLSAPGRVRWHLREKPEAASGLLRVFLRAVETSVRRSCPGAPPGARFGAVAFVHRFGDVLVAPGTTILRCRGDDDLLDVGRQRLVKPSGQGALLEAMATQARDPFDGRDQSTGVGLHGMGGEVSAAGADDRDRTT
jgi:hypothetical protein